MDPQGRGAPLWLLIGQTRVGGPSPKLALYNLGSHACDDCGLAWPGLRSIEYETELEKRTLFRALRQLEDQGQVQIRRRGGGRGKFGEYIVLPDRDRPLIEAPCGVCRSKQSRQVAEAPETPTPGSGGTDRQAWWQAGQMRCGGPAGKLVLYGLATHACRNCGLTWVGNYHLRRETELGQRTIQRERDRLVYLGLLERVRYATGGRHRATEYVVLPRVRELHTAPCSKCRRAGKGDTVATFDNDITNEQKHTSRRHPSFEKGGHSVTQTPERVTFGTSLGDIDKSLTDVISPSGARPNGDEMAKSAFATAIDYELPGADLAQKRARRRRRRPISDHPAQTPTSPEPIAAPEHPSTPTPSKPQEATEDAAVRAQAQVNALRHHFGAAFDSPDSWKPETPSLDNSPTPATAERRDGGNGANPRPTERARFGYVGGEDRESSGSD